MRKLLLWCVCVHVCVCVRVCACVFARLCCSSESPVGAMFVAARCVRAMLLVAVNVVVCIVVCVYMSVLRGCGC